MPANDDRPQVDGTGIVKVTILALFFLLVGGKFGVSVSLSNFFCCLIVAAVVYFLWRGLSQYLSSRR
jgi:hypothetical protein